LYVIIYCNKFSEKGEQIDFLSFAVRYFPDGLTANILTIFLHLSSPPRSHLYLWRRWFLPAAIQYQLY